MTIINKYLSSAEAIYIANLYHTQLCVKCKNGYRLFMNWHSIDALSKSEFRSTMRYVWRKKTVLCTAQQYQ